MRRSALLLLIGLPILAAGIAPLAPASPVLNEELARARAEQAAAEREEAGLQRAAAKARNEAGRLRGEREAAAKGIDAAEARITAADAQLHLAAAYVAAHRDQLAQQQQPVSSLLAGLAVMADRPPLFALADRGSTDELVRIRILLGSTLPVIRARTANLSTELREGRRLQAQLAAARAELVGSRKNLVSRRAKFELLEKRALETAIAQGGRALGAGDVALSSSEDVERLLGGAEGGRDAAALAAELAALGAAPPRPAPPEGRAVIAVPFAYRLPTTAPVTRGFEAVDASGVKARGITLATPRGGAVVAPATGVVRFAGPFRDYDGILIIDHGGGWMSLIVNLTSEMSVGTRVEVGRPVGRALGPIDIELSQNGRRLSPALIAGSSVSLSKARKGG